MAAKLANTTDYRQASQPGRVFKTPEGRIEKGKKKVGLGCQVFPAENGYQKMHHGKVKSAG